MNSLKTIFTSIIINLLIITTLNAQAPIGFTYQGVAHKFDGTPVANTQITVEVNILQGTDCNSNCTLVWQELHYPITNELGVFTIVIGQGQSTYAGTAKSFDSINWADHTLGNYYLKIRVDFGTSEYGNSMIDLGTTQILSVPYALVANQAGTLLKNNNKVDLNLTELNDVDTANIDSNYILVWNGQNWTTTVKPKSGATQLNELSDVTVSSPTDLQALLYNSTAGQWINTSLLLNSLSDVSITSPLSKQVLTFNGTSWNNAFLNLEDLGNVSITTPQAQNTLKFNGTNWVNTPAIFYESANTILQNPSYYSYPIVLGKNTADGNSIFLDSIGSKDFVIQSAVTGTTIPDLYTDINALIYYGDFSTLTIGKNNIDPAVQKMGLYSFIEGYSNTYGGGNYIFIMGNNNRTKYFSGLYGTFTSNNAFIFGTNNQLDIYSDYSHVFGINNYINQKFNLVFGYNNYVFAGNISGDSVYTFTCGRQDSVFAKYGITLGNGLVNRSYSALILGQYNAYSDSTSPNSWSDYDPIIVVGNGTDFTNRSNSFVLLKNGDIYTNGVIYAQNVVTPYTGTIPGKIAPVKNINYTQQIMNLKVVQGDKKPFIDPYSLKKDFPYALHKYNGQYGISYIDLIPAMIKTIQQQQKTIDKQQQEINDLKKRMDKLEKMLLDMKNNK